MLTSIDFKFIFDSACLSASLGDEGLLSSANILQIEDVVRQLFAYFFLLKRLKCSAILHSPSKQLNLVPRSSRLTVQESEFCCTLDVIFHISQNSSTFGRQQLVIMNYAWNFSQSETQKYFEWIIIDTCLRLNAILTSKILTLLP